MAESARRMRRHPIFEKPLASACVLCGAGVLAVIVILSFEPLSAIAQPLKSPVAELPIEATQSNAGKTVGSSATQSEGSIHVVGVEGPLDEINRRFLSQRLQVAATTGAQLVLVQIDSPGVLGGSWDSIRELVEGIRSSQVPVAFWIGPAGSSVERGAFWLYLAGHIKGVSPASQAGSALPAELRPPNDGETLRAERSFLATAFPGLPESVFETTLSAEELTVTGLADFVAPTLGDAIVSLDGISVTVAAARGENRVKTLHTAQVVTPEIGPPSRQPSVEILFYRLGFFQRILHSSAAPPVAYMLILAAILLLALEFYTAGIGIVALLGGICLLIGGYGLGTAGPNWIALAGLGASVPLFASDIQKGIRSFATIGGAAATAVALAAASFQGPPTLRLPLWLSILLGSGYLIGWRLGVVVMVRTRFWAPVIAREKLIGAKGTVRDPLDPQGVVAIEGGKFSAISANENIPRGEEVIVSGISGWKLVVEKATNLKTMSDSSQE